MTKTIYDLIKAMINATLILLALCLFLGWKLMASVDSVTDKVTEAIAHVTPVQDRIQNLRAEVAGLRSDLVNHPELAVSNQLNTLDDRLASLQNEMSKLRQLPKDIVHDAAQSGAAELAGRLTQLAGCLPSPAAE